ncbi:MAG: hypothetical protein ACI4JC_00340 [Faecalibacterium sp.]
MGPLLIRERYKVVQVLDAAPDYAALCAVDIRQREKPQVLLNVYEGACLRKYLRLYQGLQDCPAFQGAFIERGALVAVFPMEKGVGIDEVFQRGLAVPWELRLAAADDLMAQALRLSELPPELACPTLLSGQVRVFPQERRLALRWLVRPMDCALNERELLLLLGDQLHKLLLPRWDAPQTERDFLCEMEAGRFSCMVDLYAHWRALLPRLREEYETLEAMHTLSRFLRLAKRNGKDAFRKALSHRRREDAR